MSKSAEVEESKRARELLHKILNSNYMWVREEVLEYIDALHEKGVQGSFEIPRYDWSSFFEQLRFTVVDYWLRLPDNQDFQWLEETLALKELFEKVAKALDQIREWTFQAEEIIQKKRKSQ